ncbi:sugar phosphate isomerase/epimerase family protein [Buttiauxella massiliensis]|uniref:sugar phosphate isomerase/epimerase family protein n=1 Tax=Buttiauxella massiliensis TaxID=2831590 RepID=UPI00126001F4|nr:sugar phosphate isomerase/epimerase family protein [Buttiauxella massiliensis]
MHKFTLSAFADEISPWLETQMDVLDKFNIRYIEMRGVNDRPLVEHSLDEVRLIKQRLDERGFAISSVGSPIGKIGMDEDFDTHLALFRHTLEIAQILEVPYIRMFSFWMPKDADPQHHWPEVLRRWQQLVAAADGYHVTLLHENEKDIFGDTAGRCLQLLEALDTPKVKAVFDPANFVQCGVTPFPNAFEALQKHIAYIHIKDALFTTGDVMPAGQGDGRIGDMLEELAASGYHGFLSLEPHLADFSGFKALENAQITSGKMDHGEAAFTCAVNALDNLIQARGL